MSLAYGYVRFSSKKQEKGASRERQRELIQAYCVTHGLALADFVEDLGLSAWRGDHLSDGDLGKFAARVRSGEIPPGTTLVVENIDRLSRQDYWTATIWLREMVGFGLRIAAIANNKLYDAAVFASTTGMIETMGLFMAQDAANKFSENISTRLKDSWVRRREEASRKVVVSAHVPGWLEAVGERGDPKRHFREIPERAAVVREIYQLAAEGVGAPAIAKTLNLRGVKPWGKDYHHRESNKVGWEPSYTSGAAKELSHERH